MPAPPTPWSRQRPQMQALPSDVSSKVAQYQQQQKEKQWRQQQEAAGGGNFGGGGEGAAEGAALQAVEGERHTRTVRPMDQLAVSKSKRKEKMVQQHRRARSFGDVDDFYG